MIKCLKTIHRWTIHHSWSACFAVLLSFGLSLLYSFNALAIVTTDAYPVAVFEASTLNGVTTSGDCLGINGGVYAGSNPCNLYHFNLTGISSPFQVADKDIIMVRAIVANNAQNDAVDVSGGGNVYGEINGAVLTIVDFSYYQLSNSQGMATWAFMVNGDSTINGPFNLKTVTGQQIFTIFPGEGIQSGGINVYRTTVKSTDRIINSVEAINSAIASALQNQVDIKNWVIEVTDRQDDQKQYLQSIEELLKGISQNASTAEAINNQTEQQQSQYETEKQEEADREESGSEQANQLGSLFSFTAFNPFSGLFGLFTNGGGCINIPTIAALLNTDETTYCPWFSASIRSILTPIIGMSSMMLIFGYFVRWLNDGSFDGAVEV